MNCAVCFRLIRPQRDAYIVASEIYMVTQPRVQGEYDEEHPPPTRPRYAAHLICWIIRLSMPIGEEGQPRSLKHCRRPAVPVTFGNNEKMGKCHFCQDKFTAADSIIKYGACQRHGYHLGCASLTGNVRRRLICDFCTSNTESKGKTDEALAAGLVEDWTGLMQYMGYEPVTMGKSSPSTIVKPESISVMMTNSATVPEILASTMGWDDDYDAFPFDTAAKHLCHELWASRVKTANTFNTHDNSKTKSENGGVWEEHIKVKSSQISCIAFMAKYKYTIEAMLKLGLHPNMLLETDTDWTLLLNPKKFPVSALLRLRLNFTRLLFLGMDMALFVAAGYTKEDLVALRFNVPGFLAAGGTREELHKLLGVTDLKQVKRGVDFALEDLKLNDSV